jgi:thiol:disulfide interchange protein DsbA
MKAIHTPARRAALLVVAFFAALAFAAVAPAQELQEGKQYLRYKSPAPAAPGSKIEVLEFFSYGCPHCADLEPEMQAWMKTLPADVAFRRVPVMFQERWVILAKVYYTLEAMGEERRLSPDVFAAIHKNGVNLASEKAFFDWAASKGLDRKKVEDVYNSFAVAGKINKAKTEAQQYNVQSVPMIVIDGKFMTATDKVGTHAALPPAINALVVKARAERPKS